VKSVEAQAPPPVVPAPNNEAQKPLEQVPPKESEAAISGAPQPNEPRILSKEEKVEYRDQDGNLLNEEQIKALEGKVEFQTKYETKTRVVDGEGNEIPEPAGGWPEEVVAVAPPHPDVEGVDKETIQVEDAKPPQEAAASREGEKEAEQAKAKPASDNKEATVQDEL
jgi:dolichyl-phosphate-mannose-protein mannosyltransferase